MTNLYEMSATMVVETDDVHEQKIAIERMNFFLQNQIEDCIFVGEKEKTAIENYKKAGMKVCVIPDEPYDQIVGMILMNKCNAIMEDRITVEEIVFGSKLSNMIRFGIPVETAITEYSKKDWYNDSSPRLEKASKKEKIVPLFEKNDWADLKLTWNKE